MKTTPLPSPDREKILERPFAAIPCRFLSEGYFTRLSSEGRQLYFVLNLVADRRGVSFYPPHRLRRLLSFTEAQWNYALAEVINHNLVAHRAGLIQVLSLPTVRQAPAISPGLPTNSLQYQPKLNSSVEKGMYPPDCDPHGDGIPLELKQILKLLADKVTL